MLLAVVGAGLVLGPGVPGTRTEVMRIVTSSMTPTLQPGDRVLVSGADRGGGRWQRGDVVELDLGATPVIKRIVGLPGDLIALRDGRLVRNGIRVDEPWSPPQLIDGVYFGPVEVPPHQVFVLGDNRRASRDSRDFGPVPGRDVVARVIGVVWPPSRTGTRP
jgi:signal peptidase I